MSNHLRNQIILISTSKGLVPAPQHTSSATVPITGFIAFILSFCTQHHINIFLVFIIIMILHSGPYLNATDVS